MLVKKKCLKVRHNYCTSSITIQTNSPKFQFTCLLSKYDQHFHRQYKNTKHITYGGFKGTSINQTIFCKFDFDFDFELELELELELEFEFELELELEFKYKFKFKFGYRFVLLKTRDYDRPTRWYLQWETKVLRHLAVKFNF